MTGKLGVHALVFGDAWTETTAKATCQAAADIAAASNHQGLGHEKVLPWKVGDRFCT